MFLVTLVTGCRSYFARVDVHSVLALFGKTDIKSYQIIADVMRRIFGQPFLFGSIFVQCGHEISEWSGHSELHFQLTTGEHERVLMGDCDQAEQAGRFHGPPFTTCAVWQRHHHCLQIFAVNFKLAHAFKLHRLARQVLARSHGVGEDVQ